LKCKSRPLPPKNQIPLCLHKERTFRLDLFKGRDFQLPVLISNYSARRHHHILFSQSFLQKKQFETKKILPWGRISLN
jgi:hypothetical protein